MYFRVLTIFSERRVTLTNSQAELVTGVGILLLALSIPSAYIILVRTAARSFASCSIASHRKIRRVTRNARNETVTLPQNEDAEANEQTPLFTHKPAESLWTQIYCIWTTSASPQSSVMGFMALVNYQAKPQNAEWSWKHYEAYAGRVILSTLFSVVAIAVFLALAFSTILSTNITTESAVLSSHPDCGVWIRKPEVITPSPTGYDYLQEVEASNYAKKCYHSSLGTDGCNAFLTQIIPYTNASHRQCPFEDSLCLDGRYSAYTLDTGAVSSKRLGINVDIGYTFRRTTTCSPIQRRVSLSEDQQTYLYEYGASTKYGNVTWISSANPIWEFAGYNVAWVLALSLICRNSGKGELAAANIQYRTLVYKQNSSTHTWQPSAEFKPWNHQAITLLLVQSQKNYHTTPQSDPIFPAGHGISSSPGQPPLYFNDDPIATALACVDNTAICEASGKICFPDINRPDLDLPASNEIIGYYMQLQALVDSSIFQAIQLLGSRALVAEAKLEREVSLPLEKEQWKVEAGNLFEAALVRIQITLRDYIRGTAAKDPEYVDRTQAHMKDMCHAYKFPGRGWQNVTVSGMVLVVLLVFLIYVLGFEVQVPHSVGAESTDGSDRQCHATDAQEEQHLLVEPGQRIIVAEWILIALFGLADGDSDFENQDLPPEQERADGLETPTLNEGTPRCNGILNPVNQERVSQDDAGSSRNGTSPQIGVEGVENAHEGPRASEGEDEE